MTFVVHSLGDLVGKWLMTPKRLYSYATHIFTPPLILPALCNLHLHPRPIPLISR